MARILIAAVLVIALMGCGEDDSGITKGQLQQARKQAREAGRVEGVEQGKAINAPKWGIGFDQGFDAGYATGYDDALDEIDDY